MAGGIPILVHNTGDACKPAYVWRPNRPFVNDHPQDPVSADALIKPGEPLAAGDYVYVVKRDGSLAAALEDNVVNFGSPRLNGGHTSLSADLGAGESPAPVLMAGRFTADENGRITMFDNDSGHYHPGYDAWEYDPEAYMPLEDVARQAFEGFGLPAPGSDAWDPYVP
ncbi:hypothetical protein ACGFZQ_52220 [Streptomyces sp. NPDC048254]|uniref:hypothetical protein n=1 Tax=Streptomyces sp. NPDC048254 TaxID=3365525 RepID=UPI003715C1FA